MIAQAVRAECDARDLYRRIAGWAEDMKYGDSLPGAPRRRHRAYSRLRPPTGPGSDGVPKRPLAALPCAKPGGSRGGHGHARRRHRHQRGHLWGASWRRVRPGRDSRPMDRIACSPAALARIASGRRMRGVDRALDFVRRGGPGGVGYDTDRSGADEVRRPEL